MAKSTRFVHATALNVRVRPTTTAPVVGKLKHGAAVVFDPTAKAPVTFASGETAYEDVPFQVGNLFWVYITSPLKGWVAFGPVKGMDPPYLQSTKPKPGKSQTAPSGGGDGGGDGGDGGDTAGGVGFLGFAAVAGLAWWFLGRKKK